MPLYSVLLHLPFLVPIHHHQLTPFLSSDSFLFCQNLLLEKQLYLGYNWFTKKRKTSMCTTR